MEMNVKRALAAGITVADLKAELDNYNDDTIVIFTCDYGDYNHTIQALPVTDIREMDDTENITRSGYSHSGMELNEDKDFDEDELDDEEKEERETELLNRPKVLILESSSRARCEW